MNSWFVFGPVCVLAISHNRKWNDPKKWWKKRKKIKFIRDFCNYVFVDDTQNVNERILTWFSRIGVTTTSNENAKYIRPQYQTRVECSSKANTENSLNWYQFAWISDSVCHWFWSVKSERLDTCLNLTDDDFCSLSLSLLCLHWPIYIIYTV